MCHSTLYRASLPHAALYIMSINRVKKKSVHSVRIIGVLRDGAHVLQNASATFFPLPFQHLHLYMLYPSLPSPSHYHPYPVYMATEFTVQYLLCHPPYFIISSVATGGTLLSHSLIEVYHNLFLHLTLPRISTQLPQLTLHQYSSPSLGCLTLARYSPSSASLSPLSPISESSECRTR